MPGDWSAVESAIKTAISLSGRSGRDWYFLRTRNDRGYEDEKFADTAGARRVMSALGTPVLVAGADVSGLDPIAAAEASCRA